MHIPTLAPGEPQAIAPTDVSQFVRLEQCQRYLRLRLHERTHGLGFMRDHGMTPQAMPPSLTQSGATFEATIEADVAARLPTTRFSSDRRKAAGVAHDNAEIVGLARDLPAGEAHVLFQPRLQTNVGAWRLRGDVDIVRLERTVEGDLRILVADMKSSSASRVEHRLQVAFYHEMLATILGEDDVAHRGIELAILYRGPAELPHPLDGGEDAARLEAQREAAADLFGTDAGLLDVIEDRNAYIGSVHDLVLGDASTARRLMQTDFDEIPFHLTSKCDGCLFNEFCMRRSAERDDLSLLPHITEGDKGALIRRGVATVTDLANLKDLRTAGQVAVDGEQQDDTRLTPAPGKEALARSLATAWPVGGRLDELIHRARRYRKFKEDDIQYLSYIPGKGYGSLPYSDANQNPNLVRIYVDAQHDYLNDRVYLLGALVVGSERGVERPERRRSVVRLAEGPPDTPDAEEALLVGWIAATLQAVAEVAAPDADGLPRAPIHLVFINPLAQRALLDALGRHATTILGATALYDFVTQLAAYDSPISSFLDVQIREKKNYPMVCQSLQAVAAFLQFNWNEDVPYRDLFRTRLFDFWGRLDDPSGGDPGTGGWYTSRARFNSQIPLEYAHAAWGELPAPASAAADDVSGFRGATMDLLRSFHARRLEAMEHIAHDFAGNKQTVHTPFDLPDLASFQQKATSFAQALDEFVTIERHVELSAWKNDRLAAPEQRVLRGQTLIVRYVEEDQAPGVAGQNRENERRRQLQATYRAAWKAANPDKRLMLTKEQKEESGWKQDDLVFRLRIETAGLPCDLDDVLKQTTLREGGRFVIYRRHTFDGRLPQAEQTPFTPTPKQLLYGMRAQITRFDIIRENGRAVSAHVEATIQGAFGGGGSRGFLFGTIDARPLEPGALYTLDDDPNDINGFWASKITEGLIGGGENRLHTLMTAPDRPDLPLPPASIEGQARFLDGLDALHEIGALHGFEQSKRRFIGDLGASPLLLVQGPPGTGKSYSTTYALLARVQGAMAAGRPFRVFLSCKTHAATDVLLHNLRNVQEDLAKFARLHPAIFARHFDPRLLDIPLYRLRPRGEVQTGIIGVPRDDDREKGTPRAWETIEGSTWCVVASTPGGVYGLVKERWPKALFGQCLAHCLVLDEASQMNIPEAVMAALPLAPDGALIVVGDHRQMPPIVKNDWSNEPRRTFQEFKSYESLFLALLPIATGLIQFEESFRLHADMAEFLRKEIYVKDGIAFHSNKRDLIDAIPFGDSFVSAVLSSPHPLTVVVHDEAQSQLANPYEQQLMAPILAALAEPTGHNLSPYDGLGVVVPHRAQRAALQDGVRALNVYDEHTGNLLISAVDTVERFQGGERTVILIGATESDREYLLVSGKFLLDPRRLTVALSRAKRKLVLVASRSVFEVFSADEETFQNAQLWKNLLRTTCTEQLWDGDLHGVHVEVWGNPPTTRAESGGPV